ncbi:MAG: hypothetical protein ACHQYQ_11485 [Bacteriovoracales bacterium]
MKNIYKLVLLTFSLWSFYSRADCPNGFFKFYCRGGGGMKLQNRPNWSAKPENTWVIGKFNKNSATFSGGGSIGLGVGRCTWHDRTLYETEPVEFGLEVFRDSMPNQVTSNLLAQCVSNSKCWFESCASNPGGISLQLVSDEFTTNFEATP